uniref:Uncharacterized protein n=1 Tax=Oryza meridionalis TaxID=40149 RepID=A0A0E0DAC2_9ORYZ
MAMKREEIQQRAHAEVREEEAMETNQELEAELLAGIGELRFKLELKRLIQGDAISLSMALPLQILIWQLREMYSLVALAFLKEDFCKLSLKISFLHMGITWGSRKVGSLLKGSWRQPTRCHRHHDFLELELPRYGRTPRQKEDAVPP